MCHQFTHPSLKEISAYLKGLNLPLVQPNFTMPEHEVFPKQKAAVLLYQDEQLQLCQKNWGYPSFNKQVLFNARIERFYEKKPSMWDKSFARQRCIIITKKFYENSSEYYLGKNQKKYRKQYSFTSNYPLTLIAGIYEQDHFAMVTTSPNKIMQPIHDRMPLVLSPNEIRRWLFQNFTSLIDRANFDLNVFETLPKNK